MIDIGTMFSKSWERFSATIGMSIVIYLVGGLVAGLLGGITLGIVAIPVIAGMVKVYRNVARGGDADFGDLFSEFSNFGQWFMLWVFWLVLGIVLGIVYFLLMLIVIGVILLPFIGLAIGVFLFFMFPLMLDKRMGAFDAARESFNKVKGNFGGLIGPIILAILVAGAGGMVFGIGALFTAPWMMIAMWIIYDAVYGPASAHAAAPSMPPPDPSAGG
jgi:uncharacterized membrane protein